MQHFKDFKFNRQLLNAVDDLGYKNPTEIQQKAIPLIMAGHDLLGIAQTGTGKTAAYVLPLLMKIKYAQGKFPRGLILGPTKELAIQINDHLNQMAKYCDIRSIALYGGVGPKTQIGQLEEGMDIIVATPGRFLELYRSGALITKEIKTLVLDEADRMMDMGFASQLREILEKIPVKRQNLLFSATFPEKVKAIADEFLEFPQRVEVTPESTPAATVNQYFYRTPNFRTKINLLHHLLLDASMDRVLIFVKKKETANNLFKYLTRSCEEEVRVIHANKGQNSRINAVNDFKEGNVRVMVSTDVSSRGLDIELVSHVINFDVPVVYEDYVHRIGRTGRAENQGTAITFANKAEEMHIVRIQQVIKQEIPEMRLPDEVEVVKTDKEEIKLIEMEIDRIKRRENPDYKGAFHKKKNPKPHSGASAKKHQKRNKRK